MRIPILAVRENMGFPIAQMGHYLQKRVLGPYSKSEGTVQPARRHNLTTVYAVC